MPNEIMEDLILIDQLEREVDSLSNDDEKLTLLNKIIKITDKYSMELDKKHSHSGLLEDIHNLAGKRADTFDRLIKIYTNKHHRLEQQHTYEEAKLLEDKISELYNNRNKATIKRIEPHNKYD